jgi:hypothetical protein
MLELLINCVYEGEKRNEEFGFFIYDLLRSKMVVESVDDIARVIRTLE